MDFSGTAGDKPEWLTVLTKTAEERRKDGKYELTQDNFYRHIPMLIYTLQGLVKENGLTDDQKKEVVDLLAIFDSFKLPPERAFSSWVSDVRDRYECLISPPEAGKTCPVLAFQQKDVKAVVSELAKEAVETIEKTAVAEVVEETVVGVTEAPTLSFDQRRALSLDRYFLQLRIDELTAKKEAKLDKTIERLNGRIDEVNKQLGSK